MKKLLLSLLVAVGLIGNSEAAVIAYSSYPSTDYPILGVNEGGIRGVLFTTDSPSYRVSSIAAALTFLPGYNFPNDSNPTPILESTTVSFQLWSSTTTQLYGDNRQRPDQLLGSWYSEPIAANKYSPSRIYSFNDIYANIVDGPTLTSNSSYWFIIDTLWNGMNPNASIQWAGSASVTGYGHGLQIISTYVIGQFPDLYSNMDPGGFPAFKIEGQVLTIPEPSTYALFGIGAFGLLMVMRRKKTA